MKYQVHIQVMSVGMATVDASSLGEAYEIAQNMSPADFDFIDGADQWYTVREDLDRE